MTSLLWPSHACIECMCIHVYPLRVSLLALSLRCEQTSTDRSTAAPWKLDLLSSGWVGVLDLGWRPGWRPS